MTRALCAFFFFVSASAMEENERGLEAEGTVPKRVVKEATRAPPDHRVSTSHLQRRNLLLTIVRDAFPRGVRLLELLSQFDEYLVQDVNAAVFDGVLVRLSNANGKDVVLFPAPHVQDAPLAYLWSEASL